MAKSNVIDELVEDLSSANGVVAIAVVEVASGMTLGSFSTGKFDPEVASAANVEVVKAKLKAIKALKLKETIDDILITLDTQYHIINVSNKGTHMIYFAAEKDKANLAMARSAVRDGVNALESSIR